VGAVERVHPSQIAELQAATADAAVKRAIRESESTIRTRSSG